ncbi:hypothetical protein PAHAL_7G324400 [Panicum hallii]|jgi:hypothetical protein|uniref:Uncharacterized protein n=1 Tax=Panicum hallii TaxID=206008 RepID=A0A2T8IE86_9POAL|nr:hypothetical protein PAHAL_7G324400 [Panicum hallii]
MSLPIFSKGDSITLRAGVERGVVVRVFLFSLFPHPLPPSTCFIISCTGREKITPFSLLRFHAAALFCLSLSTRYYRTQDLSEDICVRAVFLPSSLSLSLCCLPSFLSLKTTSNEDHAQHKRQAGPSPDPLCQSPNLPFSVLPTLSSPTLTPLPPLSLPLLLSLSPSSLLPPTIPSPAF